MTELFTFLVGTCSLYWCSFTTTFDKEDLILQVNVYNKHAEVINAKHYYASDLLIDTAQTMFDKE